MDKKALKNSRILKFPQNKGTDNFIFLVQPHAYCEIRLPRFLIRFLIFA